MPKVPGELKPRRPAACAAEQVDPGHFRRPPKRSGRGAAAPDLPEDAARAAGVDLSGKDRAGTFLQVDRSVLCRERAKGLAGKVDLLPMGEALERHPSLKNYLWRLLRPRTDRFTAAAARVPAEGYFIRIRAGRKVELPLQACLAMARSGSSQVVHNIVVAEEGSAAHLITGCTVHPDAASGLHLGVSEFYVEAGASLTFTMIHNWSEGFHVRPRSAALVAAGGSFVSNYVVMKPLDSLQMSPITTLAGKGARSRFQALLYGRGRSVIDIGSRTVLEGEGSRSEALSRAIASDESVIVAKGTLTARTDSCRAHLECRGLITSAGASMHAVPELVAEGVPHAELSHEAAISPIAEEEVSYLMSRGLSREEALAAIVRGFLNVEIPGLPRSLQEMIDRHVAATPPEGGGL